MLYETVPVDPSNKTLRPEMQSVIIPQMKLGQFGRTRYCETYVTAPHQSIHPITIIYCLANLPRVHTCKRKLIAGNSRPLHTRQHHRVRGYQPKYYGDSVWLHVHWNICHYIAYAQSLLFTFKNNYNYGGWYIYIVSLWLIIAWNTQSNVGNHTTQKINGTVYTANYKAE